MRTIRVVSPGQSYRKCTSSATLYVRCLQCLPQAHTPSIALRHHSSKKEGCHKLVLGVCLKWCSGRLFFFFFFSGGGRGGGGARGPVSCSALLHVQLPWGLWPLRSEACRFHMLFSICCCYQTFSPVSSSDKVKHAAPTQGGTKIGLWTSPVRNANGWASGLEFPS